MVAISTRELSGWGQYPRSQAKVWVPERISELELPVAERMIARGRGRSYGDAAMISDGLVILSDNLNQRQSFDDSTGVLRAEAGLTLAEVIRDLAPRGWFPGIVPGTKWVTLGGCIAADIHGKNHHRDGTFGTHVRELQLLLPDGTHRRISRSQNPELFWATIGGMGLTGIISEVTLTLMPIETPWIVSQHHQAKDLDESLELLADPAWDDSYTVAWIDCLAHGKSLGRGIFIRGHHALTSELPPALKRKREIRTKLSVDVRFNVPSWILNPFTVKTFNELYYRYQARRSAPFVCDYDSFFFPLDRVGHWNRIYGRRGFVQYQCVLPAKESRHGLELLLRESQRSKRPSFLAVLKRFGPQGQGLLSFPLAGHTLTMDFPVDDPGLFGFLDRLDEIVLNHGGRVYLAKDARLKKNVFRSMYPRVDEWLRIKRQIDARDQFASDLGCRLGLMAKDDQVSAIASAAT